MPGAGSVGVLLHHFKFFDIFVAFTAATLLFAYRCERRSHFWLRAACVILPARLLCLVFARTYGGSIAVEALYSAALIFLLFAGLMFCYHEMLWNMVFYFGSGFMTWYITDRLFLTIESICRLSPALDPFFIENTIPHIFLYIGSFILGYLLVFLTISGHCYLGDKGMVHGNAYADDIRVNLFSALQV